MHAVHCLVNNHSKDPARLRAEHGAAFIIETPAGKILFDTGASGDALVQNAEQMGFDLHQIDALVLSHAHDDHTGGLEAFFGKSKPGLPLFAHPDLFRPRFSEKDDEKNPVGLRMERAEMSRHAALHLTAEPSQVLPGVWTTGEITTRAEFEGRSTHHYIWTGEAWQPDPYRDDISLVVDTPMGLVLVCGCCHAGLLNTLVQVKQTFKQEITAIAGGTHLISVTEDQLDHAISILRHVNFGKAPYFFLNHCTGKHALKALTSAFGDQISPCPAGTVLRFDATGEIFT